MFPFFPKISFLLFSKPLGFYLLPQSTAAVSLFFFLYFEYQSVILAPWTTFRIGATQYFLSHLFHKVYNVFGDWPKFNWHQVSKNKNQVSRSTASVSLIWRWATLINQPAKRMLSMLGGKEVLISVNHLKRGTRHLNFFFPDADCDPSTQVCLPISIPKLKTLSLSAWNLTESL